VNPGTVRFGGVAVFLNIGLSVSALAFILISPSTMGLSFMVIAALAGYVLGLVTLWCLAGYLTSQDFDRANGVIFMIILLSILYLALSVLSVVLAGPPDISSGGQVKVKGTIWLVIVNALVSLILFGLGFKLGKRVMSFATEYERPRIWLWVGLCIMTAYALYFMYLFFIVSGIVLVSGPTVLAGLGLLLAGSLAGFAGYILMGIGLIQGADQMEYEAGFA
jgi:hypothetical protein